MSFNNPKISRKKVGFDEVEIDEEGESAFISFHRARVSEAAKVIMGAKLFKEVIASEIIPKMDDLSDNFMVSALGLFAKEIAFRHGTEYALDCVTDILMNKKNGTAVIEKEKKNG